MSLSWLRIIPRFALTGSVKEPTIATVFGFFARRSRSGTRSVAGFGSRVGMVKDISYDDTHLSWIVTHPASHSENIHQLSDTKQKHQLYSCYGGNQFGWNHSCKVQHITTKCFLVFFACHNCCIKATTVYCCSCGRVTRSSSVSP